MTFKYKVMLLWTIWSMYKVVTTSNQVVLVHRHFRDSFRVGKDGCVNNTNVCKNSATCQTESGLCRCNEDSLHFVNHVEDSYFEYNCVNNENIAHYVGGYSFLCNIRD